MDYFKLKDLDYHNKRVLVRLDIDVPLKDGEIVDDTRLRKSLPTLTYLLDRDARIIIMGHIGRPKGEVVKEKMADKVALQIKRLLDDRYNVKKLHDCIGINQEIETMGPKDIVVLENLRFHPEEEANDPGFAEKLASLADIYVNDAFASYRPHASVVGVPRYLPSAMGLQLEKELSMASVIDEPDHPFVVLMGGLKISNKITVIDNLLKKADVLLICGAMANTFLKAQGRNIGRSVHDPDSVEYAKELLSKNSLIEFPNLEEKIYKMILPIDYICAEKLEKDSRTRLCTPDNIPDDHYIVDIGPKTLSLYQEIIHNAQMVFWNGPAGYFEIEEFAFATNEIAKYMAQANSRTFIGGGDTGKAVHNLDLEQNYTHVSTGGGAFLAAISGTKMPIVEALEQSHERFKDNKNIRPGPPEAQMHPETFFH